MPSDWRGTSLVGRAHDGSWKTAPAKQYPAGLCELLASAVIEHTATMLLDAGVAAPAYLHPAQAVCSCPDVAQFYMPLDPYNADHQWGRYGSDFSTR